MYPTKQQISEKYGFDGENIIFVVDSGRFGKYKAGTRAGSLNNKGIRMVSLAGKYYQAHQFIWTIVNGKWPERVIRHINGNHDDNRIENLRMDSLARGRRSAPLDPNRLREVIDYNQYTGEFFWKISPRNRTLPGDKVGFLNDGGYLVSVIDKQRIRLHIAAWSIYYGEMPKKNIDHINGIRNDNRICNLRLATKSENGQNTATRKDNKTGRKGVHRRKDTNKFSASIAVDKKTLYLGCFDAFDLAVKAREEAELKFHPYRAVGR